LAQTAIALGVLPYGQSGLHSVSLPAPFNFYNSLNKKDETVGGRKALGKFLFFFKA